MSKERELLRRALEAWLLDEDLLVDEALYRIQDFLAAEEGKQEEEPVAYRHLMEDGWEYFDAPTGEDCDGCQSLFLRPSPQAEQRKPLTEGEISNEYSRNKGISAYDWFWTGVRWAEVHHGILET